MINRHLTSTFWLKSAQKSSIFSRKAGDARCLLFILLLIFLCFPLTASEDYSIIFVHIGKEIPSYTETAIAQARAFNSNCKMILVANQEALNTFAPKTHHFNLTYISCESLIKTKEHEQFIKETRHDKRWKHGFWCYTSERFLYLSDLINQYDLENIFHLENDNMLYANLSNLLPIFQNHYPGIAATFDNDDRCIAGFMYIHDSKPMNLLAKYFAEHASKGIDDMQLVALFKRAQAEEIIDHLPIITEEYIKKYTLRSVKKDTAENPFNYCLNIDQFESIFDAASLGQFLGGIDPSLGYSRPGYINKGCLFNPSLLTIEWINDEQQRKIPYLVYPHGKYRINNLHIHCKKLRLFSSINKD